MIASLGGDVKSLALSPPFSLSIARYKTHSAVLKKSRRPELDPCGVVCLYGGMGLSRARSNLPHAVVVTLPRIGKSSEKRKEF